MEKLVKVEIREAGFRQGFTLRNIDFELKAGDLLLVTGRSGSGKSVLLKTVAGLIKVIGGFIDGVVLMNGLSAYDTDVEELNRFLTYIPQEPWFGVIGPTVKIDFCHTLSTKGLDCDLKKLSRYGLGNLLDQPTFGLSVGQIQRLLLSEALESGSKVLLLDEPLAYVDAQGRETVIKAVEEQLSKGGAVVVVDHLPLNWLRMDPKVLTLERGEPVDPHRYLKEVNEVELTRRCVKSGDAGGEAILKAENMWFKYPASGFIIKGVDFELKPRSLVGLIGPNGSGKSTLLKLLAGVYKPSRGRVVRLKPVVYIPENPLLYLTHPNPREELYGANARPDLVEEIIEVFDLKHVLDTPLAKLSSGERRRVALASALLRGYSVFLLDEPTSGFDRFLVQRFVEAVGYMYEKGASFLIAHHDPRLNDVIGKQYVIEKGVLREHTG